MSDQAILEKAIQKAHDNGWEGYYTSPLAQTFMVNNVHIVHVGYDLIFNHDFAKALWGDGERPSCHCDYDDWTCDDVQHNTSAWQYHLQQMVIADDPIKYLGENI